MQKMEEEQKNREIEAKLQQYGQMELRLTQLQQSQEDHQQAENAINMLGEMGLLKRDAQGNFERVESWEEHQQLLQERADES